MLRQFVQMQSGRAGLCRLNTTCADFTKSAWPCLSSQSSVAEALRAASMVGELTKTMAWAMSNTPLIAECMLPVQQSERMTL